MEKGSNDAAPERLTVSALNFLSSPLPPLYRSRTPSSFFLISKLQEDELQRMENDPSNKRFTSLSMMPFDNEEHLTYMYAGWAGQFREYGVTPSVLRKCLQLCQLLELGASPVLKDTRKKRTPLQWAKRTGKHDIVALLVAKTGGGASVPPAERASSVPKAGNKYQVKVAPE